MKRDDSLGTSPNIPSAACRTALLQLLQSALWGRAPQEQTFQGLTRADWQSIFLTAQAQTVMALAFQAFEFLPDELLPVRVLDLIEHGLEAFLEFAAVFRPGDHGTQVEADEFLVALMSYLPQRRLHRGFPSWRTCRHNRTGAHLREGESLAPHALAW